MPSDKPGGLEILRLLVLAAGRSKSPEAYFEFQHYQGALLARYLTAHGVRLDGKRVLDVGSGVGGYGRALAEAGARLHSVDLEALFPRTSVRLIQGDAQRLPIASQFYDLVVCSNLIEHVASASGLIQELSRVLRSEGVLYLSFPPFYSPRGGHQFSPFHYLGERPAVWLAIHTGALSGHRRLAKHWPREPRGYADAFGDWGLRRTTIDDAEALLAAHSYRVIDLSARWVRPDFSRIPVLRELLTWHVQFLARRAGP